MPDSTRHARHGIDTLRPLPPTGRRLAAYRQTVLALAAGPSLKDRRIEPG
jgi:hypothetical protein